MYEFNYLKPKSLDEAVAALADDEATLISGGQTLLPTLKARLAQPTVLVDLTGLGELKGISVDADSVTIGGAVRHADVAVSADVKAAIPALAELAGKIGDPQVRNRGTIGGSVANNDPSACYPTAVLALDGVVLTNKREIAAADFFDGLYSTTLDEAEVVKAVRFKRPQAAAWMKFPQPASRFSLVGVFMARFADGVRVAVTGASEEGVFRHAGLEAALNASSDPSSVDGVAVAASGLIADIHGSPAYRANLIKVMTKRAAAACV